MEPFVKDPEALTVWSKEFFHEGLKKNSLHLKSKKSITELVESALRLLRQQKSRKTLLGLPYFEGGRRG